MDRRAKGWEGKRLSMGGKWMELTGAALVNQRGREKKEGNRLEWEGYQKNLFLLSQTCSITLFAYTSRTNGKRGECRG